MDAGSIRQNSVTLEGQKSAIMKKIFILSAIVGFYTVGTQAQTDIDQTTSEHEQCSFFMKTPPLREILSDVPVSNEYSNEKEEINKHERNTDIVIDDHGIPSNNHMDPVLQSEMGTRSGKNMLKASWTGLTNGFAAPLDPSGAAGIDYYVQAINSSFRIYEKDGTPASVSQSLASIWPGSSADGDPIVMFDRYADRWFISQFQTGSNEILIAISETSDPLGSYYLYEFSFAQFPDYPKFGVWSNAYYMTSNSWGKDCVAFEREKMLVGDPNASVIKMNFPSFVSFFPSVAPAYAEGPTEPDADEPGYFFLPQDDSWSGVSEDHILVFKCELDWEAGTGSVVRHQEIPTASFNGVFTSSWNDITQQGTTQKLDAVAGIFMYRAQYRRFDDYNVVMLCQTVDVNNNNRAGVRWYELREENDGEWYIYQEGTYNPNDGNSRWMANIAMDLNGNIGMAYSCAGPNEYAGLRFTGRFIDDPLGEMTVEEQIAEEGTGFQTGTNRYGDYHQMSVDPTDDATFWYTGNYLTNSGNSLRTKIFSFAMWQLLGEEEKSFSNPFFNAYQPNPSTVTLTWSDLKDDQINVVITDLNGKVIVNDQVATEITQKSYDVPSYATGIYLVNIAGENTNMSQKVYIGR